MKILAIAAGPLLMALGVSLDATLATAHPAIQASETRSHPNDVRGTGGPVVWVAKGPTCGCCDAWVEHLRESGFTVGVNDVEDLAVVKARYGVHSELWSCHTAIVDGYVIEGHVPADLVHRLLDSSLGITGLAVPGMPMGSPGMEGPRSEPYEILAFGADGQTEVYAER